ncbi:MAG: helix-turn-helix domain-containing protein [Pseudonocardia sp.]
MPDQRLRVAAARHGELGRTAVLALFGLTTADLRWRVEVANLKSFLALEVLAPLLAERGIYLSWEHVFRLVIQPPQRLSMDTLAALCDILDC